MEGLIRYNDFTRKSSGNNKWISLLVVLYVFIFTWGLRTYLQWQSVNLLLGIVTLCFCITINRQQTGSRRFGYLAFVFLVLLVWMPVKTILFLAVLTGVFYLVESYYGRLNFIPLLVVLIMSPFFQYLSNIFLFPIRLYLSEWTGSLLRALGSDVLVAGNIITVRQQEFSVDPACMGLNMLVVSLLLALMLIGIYQKKAKVQLPPLAVIGLLLLTLCLNIISNLLRILLIVQFAILPGNVMHDVFGIVCLVLYVIVPVALVIKFIVSKWGRANSSKEKRSAVSIFPHLVLGSLHLLLTFKVLTASPVEPIMEVSRFRANGFISTWLKEDDVMKLENQQSLIYIKPITNFYNADHNPMICWKGSGYDLKRISMSAIAGHNVYMATLEKGKEVLYTCWLYDNGKHKTISQLEWRWNMLRGSGDYAIVNVTTESPGTLLKEAAGFMKKNLVAK